MQLKSVREFIKLETAGGIILVAMAILAILFDNSPLRSYYQLLLSSHFVLKLGNFGLDKPLILIINEGLMAVFFFIVGLEIKREILVGELNKSAKLVLPGVAALGGMIVPALIYLVITQHDPKALQGWAIPVATDIAFALGILSCLGSRVPSSLKVFLTALAILDDLGAILIIAIFYTSHISMLAILLALACTFLLGILNRAKVVKIFPYILVGIVLWFCILKSGIHATLAGVIVAFCIPLRNKRGLEYSPLITLERVLHPWVAFGVLPIFAFANAGISFSGMSMGALFSSIPLGIALGLFLGKQIGIFGACYLCIRTGVAQFPSEANWVDLYGVALLCGIGFTMSLFIGTLAFDETSGNYAELVRLGVLSGSLISALMGFLLLRINAQSRVPLQTTK